MISFRVPAIPIAQPRQRQRVATINGQARAMNYTPTRHPVNAFKAALAAEAARHVEAPLDGPVWVTFQFRFPRPGRLRWKRREMLREWHGSKPDCENVAKAALDALTGICWHDDAQVARLLVEKEYASGAETAHVEVVMGQLEPVSRLLQ